MHDSRQNVPQQDHHSTVTHLEQSVFLALAGGYGKILTQREEKNRVKRLDHRNGGDCQVFPLFCQPSRLHRSGRMYAEYIISNA